MKRAKAIWRSPGVSNLVNVAVVVTLAVNVTTWDWAVYVLGIWTTTLLFPIATVILNRRLAKYRIRRLRVTMNKGAIEEMTRNLMVEDYGKALQAQKLPNNYQAEVRV